MTAREELAQSIATNLDRLFGVRDFGPATQDFKLADALLAEGWGKRRTVATVEELEALPVGSAVMRRGRVWTRHVPRTYHGGSIEDHAWMCADGGFIRADSQPVLLLPATVIYEPQS